LCCKLNWAVADLGNRGVAEAKQQQRRHSRSSQLLRPDRETALNRFRNRTREFQLSPFLLWHFSPGDKIENCAAQFLAVCGIAVLEPTNTGRNKK